MKMAGKLMLRTVCAVLVGAVGSVVGADPYGPPAGYYSGATGTGATLKTQLTSAMSAGRFGRPSTSMR